jgi:hypothetical protein
VSFPGECSPHLTSHSFKSVFILSFLPSTSKSPKSPVSPAVQTGLWHELLHPPRCGKGGKKKVNLSLKMKTYGGVVVQIHIFLTSALIGSEWSASNPGRFTTRERAAGTYWIESWASPRTGLNDVERKFLHLPGLEHRSLGRPTRSQSLYRLRYPVSHASLWTVQFLRIRY